MGAGGHAPAEDTPQVLRFLDAEEISLALKDASVLRDCPEVPLSLACRIVLL